LPIILFLVVIFIHIFLMFRLKVVVFVVGIKGFAGDFNDRGECGIESGEGGG
jgi:hypothetical protein